MVIYDTPEYTVGTRDRALLNGSDWPTPCLRIEHNTYITGITYHTSRLPLPFTVRQEQPLVSPFLPFISFPPLQFLLFLFSSSLSLHLILISSFFHLRLSSSSIGLFHRLDIRFFFLFLLFIWIFLPSSLILIHSCCLLFSLVLPYFDLFYYIFFFISSVSARGLFSS